MKRSVLVRRAIEDAYHPRILRVRERRDERAVEAGDLGRAGHLEHVVVIRNAVGLLAGEPGGEVSGLQRPPGATRVARLRQVALAAVNRDAPVELKGQSRAP